MKSRIVQTLFSAALLMVLSACATKVQTPVKQPRETLAAVQVPPLDSQITSKVQDTSYLDRLLKLLSD